MNMVDNVATRIMCLLFTYRERGEGVALGVGGRVGVGERLVN
jgi:hypothetical protein